MPAKRRRRQDGVAQPGAEQTTHNRSQRESYENRMRDLRFRWLTQDHAAAQKVLPAQCEAQHAGQCVPVLPEAGMQQEAISEGW